MQNIYKLLSKTFKLLTDVNRLKIVEALTEECQSVNEITKRAGISQPLASHHLKNLKESVIYYKNGQIEVEGYFKNGKPDGHFIWRYENGLVKDVKVYEDGILID